MKDVSIKFFWLAMFLLILTRVIMVFFLMNDIPATNVQLGGWWFHHGGDEAVYFELAKSFVAFNPIATDSPITIGFSLFLIPFVYIFQALEIQDILKPFIFLQAFVFFSFAIVLVGLIAEKIFKNRLIAIFSSTFFVFLPYLFYFLFRNIGPVYNGLTSSIFNFEHLMWVFILTDPLSALLVYLSFYLFIVCLEEKQSNNQRTVFLGLLSGFAVLTRITNIFIIGVFALILAGRKKINKAKIICLFAFLSFLPQLVYNYIFYGSPLFFKNFYAYQKTKIFTSGAELSREYSIAHPGFSFDNYYYYFFLIDKYIPMPEIVLIFLISIFVFGANFLYYKNKTGFLVIILWIIPYLLFYGLFPPAARNVRYYFPIIPPLIILSISFLFFLYSTIKTDIPLVFKKYE